MTTLWARTALTPDGWADDVRVEIAEGRITSVTAGAAATGDRVGILLPAPANAHSHAFQRAMAGLTERRGLHGQDSFWTWRALMYRFLDRLDPDAIQSIAAFVQMEMLEAGYACNVEFHYLHHAPDGTPYAELAETSARIAAAAEESGIGLTLLPVHYQFGGCDRRALGPGQRRFGNDIDRFLRLAEAAGKALGHLPPDSLRGVAPHSLRAVAPEDLATLRSAAKDAPFHMHLAEQPAEVEEVLAAYGKRPVDWALDHLDPGPGTTFVHLTQMTPDETRRLAATGAVAGLCPITESSLGDGIFDGVRWLDGNGAIAVGSDSNIRIALAEELRTLDYSQRLRDHSRAALARPGGSAGRRLYDGICAGGALAAGRPGGRIAAGAWADLLALDDGHPDLEGRSADTILDTWIFAGDERMVRDVWSAGRHLVRDGRHLRKDAITARYRRTMATLLDAL